MMHRARAVSASWRSSAPIVATGLACLLLAPSAVAQETVVEDQKVVASEGGPSQIFGTAVSVGDGVAVVAASYENSFAGAAYAYRFDGTAWNEEARLVGSGAGAFEFFGSAVANSGDLIVVGSPSDGFAGLNAGSATVFRHDGTDWIEEATLIPADTVGAFGVGRSVAVSTDGSAGDVVVVGAPGADGGRGALYVFEMILGTWTETAKLVPAGASSNGGFGSAVSASGDAVAGSGDVQSPAQASSASIFRFDGTDWGFEARIDTPTATVGDGFGLSIALSGDALAVGAPFSGGSTGEAWIYREAGGVWSLEQPLVPSTGTIRIGRSVSLCGDTAAVGGEDLATIFRFDGTTWEEAFILTASDGSPTDGFGVAVAVCDEAVVGVPFDDDNGTNSGAAYLYDLAGLLDVDTDGDGLFDSVEADLAAGGLYCLDPLVADSDGDGLSDGFEVNDLGTSPCEVDTDGDLIPDDIDPLPLDPDGTVGELADGLRLLADQVEALPLSAFQGRARSARGRRGALASQLRRVARRIDHGNICGAIGKLESVLAKIDGEPCPPDWIRDDEAGSTVKTDLQLEVEFVLLILSYLD